MIATRRLAITHHPSVFGLVWLGQLISVVGSSMTGFALGVWYYEQSGSVTQLALFSFFNVVPAVLLSPFAGVFVDRWDRRRAMLLSDIAGALCMLVIWLLFAAGQQGAWPLQPWHLYLPVALRSGFSAFRGPAYYATTTLLVSKQNLARASGVIELGPAVAQVISPTLAGVLVASVSLQSVFLIDLATFFVAVVSLLLVQFPKPESTTAGQEGKGSLLHEAKYGWLYIKTRPGLLGLLIFAAITNMTMGFIMVLIIPLVLSFTGTQTLGLIVSVAGSGMLVGGVVISLWGGPHRRINGVLGFTLLGGLLLFLGGLRPNAPLVAGASFVFLFTSPIVAGCLQAIWQSKVAPDVQGRVFAVRRMIAMSSAPLTRLVVGPLADNAFEPWLAPGGLLAGSVGQIIGTGPGRGIGLIFIILGVINVLTTLAAYLSPRIARVEDDLPDIIGDSVSFKNIQDNSKRKEFTMKRIRKWLARLGIGLLVIIIILAVAGVWFVRRPWPEVNGTLAVSGLTAQVQVIRDKWGVPHIYAQNERDLFFAQGYVHAQDRLLQIELNRRTSNGTLSEVMGQVTLRSDRAMRTLGMRRVAEHTWEVLDDDTRAILESYVAGVNAYIDTHRDRLPIEFTMLGINPQPWTPLDVLAYANTVSLSLSHNYRLELLRAQMIAKVGEKATQELFAPYAKGTPIIVPPEAGNYSWLRDARFEGLEELDKWVGDPALGWGSNNWVVHGSRTATGKPMLETDTHLGLYMPSTWYEVGLHGGRFDVVGFSLPGAPLVMVGHNQYIAWGETALGQDVQDYYIEKLDDPEHPTQYEFEGAWYPIQVVHETINIKGAAPEQLDVLITRHGPIVTDIMSRWTTSKEPMALHWTIYEGNQLAQALKLVSLAKNWDDFRAAMSYWDAPGLNIVYADVDGNIGYQATGRTPIRVQGHQGIVPVPGWTGEYEWQDYIPFDEMPFSFNPPAGFIATANNRVVSDDYPYLLTYDWFPGYRAKRISDLLAANDHVTLADMQKIEAETFSLPAEALRPYLLAVQPANDIEAQAQAEVKAWDLYFEADRVGASIYEAWYIALVRNTITDEIGEDLTGTYLTGRYERHGNQHVPMMIEIMQDPNNAWFDDVTTPQTETRDDLVRRSLTDAVEMLSQQYGKDIRGWQWGRLHTLSFEHAIFGSTTPLGFIFNTRPIPVSGDQFSVNAASFQWNNPFQVIHGTSQRMIVDLSQMDNSVSVHPPGQNEQLFHPHREDLITLWQKVQYHPMIISREIAEANAESVLTLTPR